MIGKFISRHGSLPTVVQLFPSNISVLSVNPDPVQPPDTKRD